MIFFMKRPCVTWIFFSTIHKQMESYPTSFHSMKGLWFFESPYPCIVYHSTTVSLETNPFIHQSQFMSIVAEFLCCNYFSGPSQSATGNLLQVSNKIRTSLPRLVLQKTHSVHSQRLMSFAIWCQQPSPVMQPSCIFTSLRNKLCPNYELKSSLGARFLPTLSQYRRGKARTKNDIPKKYIPKNKRILLGPQRKGVCLKVFTRKPKKPNSGNRKCALLKLSNGKVITAYIPGEGAALQEHGVVLFEGGRVQDCPGIKYKVVRRKYDMNQPVCLVNIKSINWCVVHNYMHFSGQFCDLHTCRCLASK